MTVTFPPLDLTAIAAWLGVLTGVLSLVWQFTTRRRSAHRVKVTISSAWHTYPSGELGEDLVCIAAQNVGAAAVDVTHWGFKISRTGGNLTVLDSVSGSTPLPHRLEAASSMSLYVTAAALARTGVERGLAPRDLRAWVGLATNKKVYAKRGVPIV